MWFYIHFPVLSTIIDRNLKQNVISSLNWIKKKKRRWFFCVFSSHTIIIYPKEKLLNPCWTCIYISMVYIWTVEYFVNNLWTNFKFNVQSLFTFSGLNFQTLISPPAKYIHHLLQAFANSRMSYNKMNSWSFILGDQHPVPPLQEYLDISRK